MIGLTGLQDGGHVLEHPAGPLYVTVKVQKIVRAELAPWGEPDLVSWACDLWTPRLEQFRQGVSLLMQGGDAAGRA